MSTLKQSVHDQEVLIKASLRVSESKVSAACHLSTRGSRPVNVFHTKQKKHEISERTPG